MRVFLSTADVSGDLHAAALLDALHKAEPRLESFGLGGARLGAAPGFEPIVDAHMAMLRMSFIHDRCSPPTPGTTLLSSPGGTNAFSRTYRVFMMPPFGKSISYVGSFALVATYLI